MANFFANLSNATPPSRIRVGGEHGYGSTNQNIRRFLSIIEDASNGDISYSDSATLGSKFIINTPGVYSISYNDGNDAADTAGAFAITINANPASDLADLPVAQVLQVASFVDGGQITSCPITYYLNSGDVILAQSQGSVCHVNENISAQFSIVKLS